MQQRWTDKEVVERIKESIKNHWYHIEMELKQEPEWKGTWEDFRLHWLNWNNQINNYWYCIAQFQNILDIKDEEVDEILKEE